MESEKKDAMKFGARKERHPAFEMDYKTPRLKPKHERHPGNPLRINDGSKKGIVRGTTRNKAK